MTTSDLSSFRQVLSEKQEELARSSQALDSIAVERSADALEEATYKSARELAVTSLNREAMLHRSVAMALVRIQDGTFGACAHCGDEIARRRLEAVPWTPFCICCQQAADLGEESVLESIEPLFLNAA
jgi:DnaK suppressor protein